MKLMPSGSKFCFLNFKNILGQKIANFFGINNFNFPVQYFSFIMFYGKDFNHYVTVSFILLKGNYIFYTRNGCLEKYWYKRIFA